MNGLRHYVAGTDLHKIYGVTGSRVNSMVMFERKVKMKI